GKIEHELGGGGGFGCDEDGARGQFHRTDMMIDAHQGQVSLADHRRQVAEPAEVPDVHRYDEIGALDLTHRPVARIGTIGNQEVEALGDLRRVGDAHRYTERAQQIPQPDLAPDAGATRVAVSV